MENRKAILELIEKCRVVYLNGKTIKDRYSNPYAIVTDIKENINQYTVISYDEINRILSLKSNNTNNTL